MHKSKLHRSDQGGNNGPPDQRRSRNYCFTDFREEEPKFNEKTMLFLGYGKETCPTTGKHHWQGFLCWKSAKTISACVKNLNIIGHGKVFIIEGTLKQNEEYCSKEGIYKKFGSLPDQGKREDLETLKDEIETGHITVDDLTMTRPILYHQYGRTLEKIEDIALRKKYRTEMTKGIWYVGQSGVGKSHKAFENYDPDTHYVYNKNDKGWWDGYKGQETVIINDFRGTIPYDELLELVDKWPHKVPRRNREPVPFISKTVIITSILSPDEVYRNRHEKDGIEQLLRRFEVIRILDRNDIRRYTDTGGLIKINNCTEVDCTEVEE